MNIEKAYNTWAGQYDTNENNTRDLDRKATIETLSKFDFNTVVELGSGTGKNTEWLITRAEHILCLDFSQGMLDKAAEKITSPKVKFIKTDLNRDWGVPNDFADLIGCNLTLEHIENLEFIFDQAYLKLKPNGKFFICELHPFKQYTGSKAKYETENGTEELQVFVHHISEYFGCARKSGFQLIELKEWFDDSNTAEIPRLISFLFKKESGTSGNR